MTPRAVLRGAVWLMVGIAVVAIAWIVVTGLIARSSLHGLQAPLRRYEAAVVSGDTTKAARLGATIRARAGSAHQLTSGPAWWVGSHVLGAGSPLLTTREVAWQLDRLAIVTLPRLPAVTSGIRGSSARVDLTGLTRASTRIARIETAIAHTSDAIEATDPSWFGPVGGARHEVLTRLAELHTRIGEARQAVDTLVLMLGGDGAQRYFVAVMNEAESRSVGGLPGAFAILDVDDGRVRIEHVGSDLELAHTHASVDLGAQYERFYGQDDPAGIIQNSDIGPEFPDAARIWAGMWQARSGEHVDAALALDPTALSYLMRVTGPVRLAGGIDVTSHDIVNLTQSRQYALYPGDLAAQADKRKQFLATIADAVASKLLAVRSPAALIAPLRQAGHEHRLLLWSDVPRYERIISRTGFGGVLRAGHAPFSGFVVNNAAGGKMDFYLHRSTAYRSAGCAPGRRATATFTVHNDTPSYRLPAYVTHVAGGLPPGARPGFDRLIVTYYATPGASVSSVDVDGRAQHLTSATEDTFTTVRLLLDLPADASRTVRIRVREPATTGRVQVWRQPLVYPLHVHVAAPLCSAGRGEPSVGVWTVVVGLLTLLLAGGIVARRKNSIKLPTATESCDQ